MAAEVFEELRGKIPDEPYDLITDLATRPAVFADGMTVTERKVLKIKYAPDRLGEGSSWNAYRGRIENRIRHCNGRAY